MTTRERWLLGLTVVCLFLAALALIGMMADQPAAATVSATPPIVTHACNQSPTEPMAETLWGLITTASQQAATSTEDLTTRVVTVTWTIDPQPDAATTRQVIYQATAIAQQTVWQDWSGCPSEVIVQVMQNDLSGHHFLRSRAIETADMASRLNWSAGPAVLWLEYSSVALIGV